MLFSVKGNIGRKLFEANDPELDKEWQTLKNSGTFHELVDFLHRVGVRCQERRAELINHNREDTTT